MEHFIAEHWEGLAATAAVVLPTIVQISPIKINPWSTLATAIGKAMNQELVDKVDHLQQSLDKHVASDDVRAVKQCRLRILRFNGEIMRGVKHTLEHFNDILDDITTYERYCDEHPEYENSKAVLAIENVKRVYLEYEKNNSFL